MNPDKQGSELRAEVIACPLPDAERNEQPPHLYSGAEKGKGGGVGGVKQGIADPDGLAAPNMLLLSVKAPRQARHSTGTSLMRAELVKLRLKPLNEPLSITGPCYSVITGRRGAFWSAGQLSTT